MTAQFSENLKYKGEQLSMYTEALGSFFNFKVFG